MARIASGEEQLRAQIASGDEKLHARIVSGEEHLIALMHDFMTRTDERFTAVERKIDYYALRGEAHLRSLEVSDSADKDRFRALEQLIDLVEKRVRKLEEGSGHAA